MIIYVFCLILLCIFFFLRRKQNVIPGPNIFTDLFLGTKITSEVKEHLYLHYMKLSRLFGPIFQVKLNGNPVVVITDPDVAHTALVVQADEFAGRPQVTMFASTKQESNDLGTSPYNEKFRLVKKTAGKALWGYMSGDNLEHRVEFVCEELSQIWLKEEEAFDPRADMGYPGIAVCLGAMFNTDYSPSDEDYLYARKNLDGFIDLDITGEDHNALQEQVGNEYPQFMRRKINKVIENMDDKELESIVEHLAMEGNSNSDVRIRNYLQNNMEYLLTDLTGGNVTVHSTLIWMVFFLAKYQHVQQQVYDEIINVIGLTGKICLHHRYEMPYSQATLQEIFRRGTVTPIGFPHTTTKDTQLGGYDIPKDTEITFHFFAFHHSEKYFPEPFAFKPERHLRSVENGDKTEADLVKIKCLMPFSAGRRKCPAEMVAKPEMFMIMCHLVRKWRIKFPDGKDYSEDYEPSLYSVSGLPYPFKIQPELRRAYED